MALRLQIFVIFSIISFQVAYCGQKWTGKPDYRCINFHKFEPNQYCKNLCVDNRHTDLNVMTYLNDQKTFGEHHPKVEHCYYSLGRRQLNDIEDPELPDFIDYNLP